MKNYSIVKGLVKGVTGVFVFAIPLVLLESPEWANLTIGGLLLMAVNYAKVVYKG